MFRIHKRNLFTVVNQGEFCYRELLGSNRVLLKPGLRINIPVFHKIHRVDMRENGSNIENINAFTKDNVPVVLSGTLFYKVFDPELACFGVSNYQNSVMAVGESAARSIIGRFEYDHIIRERNEINKELINVIGDSIENWGINCTRFEIQEFNPQNHDIQKQLEKQLEEERKRRANELENLGKINTAETHKKEIVLKSEGELISIKNKADAEKYAIEMKTQALLDQINNLRLSGIDPESFILEYKKIEEFGKISTSNNKEVFFIERDSIVPKIKIVADQFKNIKV
jgi:regulator of protease activity HflC (stomatin/prohibitin superfamily)